MLRFTRNASLLFKRGFMLICVDELRKFAALPADCKTIWIEFSARPAKHRFSMRMANNAEWGGLRDFARPCFTDGHRVNLSSGTGSYLTRKFGLKTFYLTVWY